MQTEEEGFIVLDTFSAKAKNQRGEHSIRAYRFSRRVFIAFDRPLFAVVRFDPRWPAAFPPLSPRSCLICEREPLPTTPSEDKKAASAFLLVPLSLPLISYPPFLPLVPSLNDNYKYQRVYTLTKTDLFTRILAVDWITISLIIIIHNCYLLRIPLNALLFKREDLKRGEWSEALNLINPLIFIRTFVLRKQRYSKIVDWIFQWNY